MPDSYTPPKSVQANAKRALDVRAEKPDSEQGMTAVGIARARDLSNGTAVSLETIRRMKAYFDRHEVDKQGSTWDEQGKGWQAWMGWGGDEGRAWANRILEEADKEDPVSKSQTVRLLKADAPQRYTLGIVYEPDVVDSQDDWATADEIEKACWEFNRRLQAPIAKANALLDAIEKAADGTPIEVSVETEAPVEKGALGVQHLSWDDDHGEILESYIAPCDMAIAKADGTVEAVKAGSWLMGIVWSPENWAKVEKGEITGLSLGGSARRVRG